MRILCRALEFGIVILFASGCASKTDTASSSPPQSVSGEVTPQLSVTLAVGNSVSLQVPAGSVTENKTLTIAASSFDGIAAPVPANAAQPFAFTPDGTAFEKPVTVTLQAVDGADEVLRLDNEQDTTWEIVDGATFANGVATFQTTHFCIYVTAASGQKGSGGASSVGGASSSSGGQSQGLGGAAVSSGGANLGIGGMSLATGGAISSGGAFTATGGKTAGAGGALVVSTGGTVAATGGKSPATGGAFAATGGVVAATGGKSPATGGAFAATGGMSPATGGSATGGASLATGGQSTTGGASSGAGGSSSVVATNFCATSSDAPPTACYTAGMTSCSTSVSACCADTGCSFALTCTLKGSAGETACISDAGSSSKALYNTAKQCLISSNTGCPLPVPAST